MSRMSSTHHYRWNDVIRDANGTVMHPKMIEDDILFIRLLLSWIVGLPTNLFIAFAIGCNSQLNKSPRNIFQLILVLCNLLHLFVLGLDIVYYIKPSDLLCKITIFIDTLPSELFFFNLLLALIDRYLASTRHELWYREKITVSRIIFWVPILNLALAAAMKWVFIGQFAPLTCSYNIIHHETLVGTLLIQFLCCLIFNILLEWIDTRQRLLSYQQSPEAEIEMAEPSNDNEENPHLPATFAHLEREAARSLIVGVAIILLLPMPLIIFTSNYFIICFPVNDSDCTSTYLSYVPYFQMALELHSIIHPVLLLCRSKEISSSFHTQEEL